MGWIFREELKRVLVWGELRTEEKGASWTLREELTGNCLSDEGVRESGPSRLVGQTAAGPAILRGEGLSSGSEMSDMSGLYCAGGFCQYLLSGRGMM